MLILAIDNFFQKKPDEATKAKMNIFKQYFALYLNIIDNVRKRKNLNKRIVYIDLFCGPGKFDYENTECNSTPLEVLEYIAEKKFSNIECVFNDLNKDQIECLKTNIINKDFDFSKTVNIRYLNMDARNVSFADLYNSNDIVLSLIDSFSYLCLNCNTIDELISNYYSDLICYFRIANIFKNIGNENEKNNHVKLFGNVANYDKAVEIIKNNDLEQLDKVKMVVKIWIDFLNTSSINKHFLPIFIRYSKEDSKIESVVFIVSKSLKGLNSIKSQLKFCDINDGLFYFYEGDFANRLFDINENYIKSYIPKDKFINSNALIEIIEESFVKKYGFLSAYSNQYIKRNLKQLEIDKVIIVKSKRKRGPNSRCFGKNATFKLKE